MKRCYAVFLLLVATYFLLAPQGIAKINPEPKAADSILPEN